MVKSASGPTVIADWSRNRIWVWPSADVAMRSLNTTSSLTLSCRAVPPGGVPVTAGLTALFTPTRSWATAGESDPAIPRATATMKIRRENRLGAIRPLLKQNLEAGQRGRAGVAVELQVRRQDIALDLHDDRHRIGYRDRLRDPEAPIAVAPGARQRNRRRAAAVAARVGSLVIGPAMAGVERGVPRLALPAGRVVIANPVAPPQRVALVRVKLKPRPLIEVIELAAQRRIRGDRLAERQGNQLVAAAQAPRVGNVGMAAEGLLAKLEGRLGDDVAGQDRRPLQAGAVAVEVLLLAQPRLVGDQIRLERARGRLPQTGVGKAKARPRRDLGKPDIEAPMVDVVVDQRGAAHLLRIAVLRSEIVAVHHGAGGKGVERVLLDGSPPERNRADLRFEE